MKSSLFPYENLRKEQDQLLVDVKNTVERGGTLIAHAPTGLGKTVATLTPALERALKGDLTVFFLTNRHTQHRIAVETLQAIQAKHEVSIPIVDLIGKRWMCGQPKAADFFSSEFNEYCKSLRENEQCEFYSRLFDKNRLSFLGKKLAESMGKKILHTDQLKAEATSEGVCPYYLSVELAKKAKVIIADYYHIFHPSVRESFFGRLDKELGKSIIIVDEAHNLPGRVRELLSYKLSTYMLANAILEARKNSYPTLVEWLTRLQEVLRDLLPKDQERLVRKDEFIAKVSKIVEYDKLVDELVEVGEDIRKRVQRSSIASVGEFLDAWGQKDEGFVRIISHRVSGFNKRFTLTFSCIDPALVTKDIFKEVHSAVLMSGTLTPTAMFKDILGVEGAEERVYENPFPEENRLTMIIPQTTTKYTQRTPTMYKLIADHLNKVARLVPGNVAFFFPSYYMLEEIRGYLDIDRKVFAESGQLSAEGKKQLLEDFKAEKNAGGVLLGVAAASFAEGIDLPGDLLKCVVIVGLPLGKPDLKTKEVIAYYDRLFGKGWEYGYTVPAINKTIQAAGRCIRSETDKGAVIFLDERFAWGNYSKLLPRDWNIKISMLWEKRLGEFFGEKVLSGDDAGTH